MFAATSQAHHEGRSRAFWAAVFAAALLASVLSAFFAAPSAHAKPVLGGGTPILTHAGQALCTATAAGYDRNGSPVAFTAGHCSSGLGEEVQVEGAGVVGNVVARNEILDYTVFSVDPSKVDIVRQGGVNDRGAPPNQGDTICKLGAKTGYTCGPTWQVEDNTIYSQVCAGRGDSGGPVMNGDRLVGMLNGGTVPPVADEVGLGSVAAAMPECYVNFQAPVFLPAYGTTFDAIVDDATVRNWPGAGFRMA
ncbi:peptidase S1 [Dietzia sp.]|uniref:peptidase S1 n=1 Tax=Dietzia sp. TaxID=1871616 RepID=UPI002FD98AE8